MPWFCVMRYDINNFAECYCCFEGFLLKHVYVEVILTFLVKLRLNYFVRTRLYSYICICELEIANINAEEKYVVHDTGCVAIESKLYLIMKYIDLNYMVYVVTLILHCVGRPLIFDSSLCRKDLDLAFDVSPTNFDTVWEGSGSSPSSLSL